MKPSRATTATHFARGLALAREAGRVRAELEVAGKPVGAYDVLIAAQARRRRATLVTSTVAEFDRVTALKWEDWAVQGNVPAWSSVPEIVGSIQRLMAPNARASYQADLAEIGIPTLTRDGAGAETA